MHFKIVNVSYNLLFHGAMLSILCIENPIFINPFWICRMNLFAKLLNSVLKIKQWAIQLNNGNKKIVNEFLIVKQALI